MVRSELAWSSESDYYDPDDDWDDYGSLDCGCCRCCGCLCYDDFGEQDDDD